MSNNPFTELAEYLDNLINAEGSLFDRLVAISDENEDFKTTHERVFLAYSRCCDILKTYQREDDFETYMVPVWKYLISPNRSWETSSGSLSRPEIQGIALLGKDPELTAFLPPILSTEELDALRVAFEKIHEIVQSHESIPQELAAHIIYLCNRGTDLLKGERVDLVALRTICFEAITLSQAASVTLPEETQGTFWDAVRSLWNRWGYPTAVNVASTIIGGVVLDEITQS